MREVNGQQYSHATVKPTAKSSGGEFPFKTHSRVSFKHTVGSDATFNAQGQRDGFTYGNEEAELTIECKLAEWEAFRAWLYTNAGGLGVAQCIFDLPIAYGNNVNALEVVVAESCHVTEEAFESSRDGGAIMMTIPIFVTTFSRADGEDFIVYET